jgi:hypothetical protein
MILILGAAVEIFTPPNYDFSDIFPVAASMPTSRNLPEAMAWPAVDEKAYPQITQIERR